MEETQHRRRTVFRCKLWYLAGLRSDHQHARASQEVLTQQLLPGALMKLVKPLKSLLHIYMDLCRFEVHLYMQRIEKEKLKRENATAPAVTELS